MAKSTFETDSQVRGLVLCVILSEKQIQSFLVSFGEDGVEIIEQSRAISYSDTKLVARKVDETLQELGEASENVDQVIFGIEHAWIANGDILPEKQKIVTLITDELSLKPQGFVDSLESLLQKQLFVSPRFSEILIEVNDTSLSIAVMIHGDLRGIESIGRSSSFVEDVAEGFARFAATLEPDGVYLPTKIVLTSLDIPEIELRKFQQDLLEVDWAEKSRFLQTPVIDVLARAISAQSIAEEAGKGVAIAMNIPLEVGSMPTVSDQSQKIDSDLSKSDNVPDDFDFQSVMPKEIETEPIVAPEIPNSETAQPTAELSEARSFGVPITSKQLAEIELKSEQLKNDRTLVTDDDDGKESKFSKVVVSLKQFLPRFKRTTKPSFPSKSLSVKKYIAIGVVSGIFAVLVVAFFGLQFMTTAIVSIIPKEKVISKILTLTLDESVSSPDVKSLTIPAERESLTLSDEGTAPSTGTSLVGDPSKGEIEIVNKTEANKIFAKGTEVSTGDLVFTLDEEVEVPTSKVEEDEDESGKVITFGKITVSVTASEIGSQGNIESGTELKVEDFDSSTYSARSATAFSGGEEREVKVVSEKDRTDIQKALRASLLEKANEEFEKKGTNGTRFLPVQNVTVVTAEYNREVGDEASELTLKLEVTAEAISYKNSDLQHITQEILQGEVPVGYALSSSEPEIMSQPKDSSDQKVASDEAQYVIEGNVSTDAIPQFETQELASQIAGKSLTDATEHVQKLETVTSVDIKLKPAILKTLYAKMPSDSQRITIQVQ
ncbi:MAG: hypothetical protein WAU07_01430 [Microgenomates group bacterium]